MKWQLKAAAQAIFGLLPGGHRVNLVFQKRFGELAHYDPAQELEPILRVFVKPLVVRFGTLRGLRVLEIGTGWTPTLPVTLGLLGADVRTFDVVRHLEHERTLHIVRELRDALPAALAAHGIAPELRCVALGTDDTLECLLEGIGVTYEAPVDSRHLPCEAESAQAIVSNRVLQHVPREALVDVLRELARTLAQDGIAIHRVNLHDEYASVDGRVSAINFLRYPPWIWERFVNNRIKYLNRERYPFYLRRFAEAGFEVRELVCRVDGDAMERIHELEVDREFSHYTAEELCTTGMRVVLEKEGAHVTRGRSAQRLWLDASSPRSEPRLYIGDAREPDRDRLREELELATSHGGTDHMTRERGG
jgi:SAM-dependent methyltransferase